MEKILSSNDNFIEDVYDKVNVYHFHLVPMEFCIENIIFAGLVLSHGKPQINSILEPIVKNLKILELGITFNSRTERFINIKFFLLFAVFDKPARAMALNIKNSNGFFGCLKCLQPGKTLKTKKKGNVHVYFFSYYSNDGPERNSENYEKCLLRIKKLSLKEYKGIIGPCSLQNLGEFKPIQNTSIDSMHSICLGVIKSLFKYWFEMPDDKFSLKRHITKINDRVLKIRSIKSCQIALRPVSEWRYYKAKDFLIFMIYYAIPVFYQIMTYEYYQHLLQSIISLEILYSEKIDIVNLETARRMLINFVKKKDTLYNSFILKSSVHELLHQIKSSNRKD
ncbi:unnamed protein product [Brachionus calyciflorus]|uniref:Uncharacterized protein n=1 Tax=Brachionus calyciflorus TaxID=104777 RepID=A0A814IBQ7_9BILA|nr:unnamed protein product [Brachionus calyciflorus]